MLIGGIVLIGWFANIETLKSLHSGWATMKTTTALCFVLSGLSLLLLSGISVAGTVAGAGRLSAALVLVAGGVTLLSYGLDTDLGIENIMYLLPDDGAGLTGKMSPGTALCFTLTGLALLTIDMDINGRIRPTEYLLFAVGITALFASAGYLYEAESLYTFFPISGMALHTALLFLVLTVGILAARPRRGLIAILTTLNGGGFMARRLLPVTVALVIGIGWVRWQGELAGHYDTALGLTLYTTANVITLIAVIWYVAGRYNRVDAERRNAQLRFQRIFEAAPNAMILMAPDGHIDLANREAEYLFGYNPGALHGLPVETLIPADLRDAHAGLRRDYLIRPEARVMGKGRELHAQRSDGTRVPVEIGLGPVPDIGGTAVLAVVIDVSQRRQAEAALHASERKLATLISNLPGMVYSCRNDADWTMTFISDGCHDLTGYDPADLLDNRTLAYADLIHPDDRAVVWTAVQAALAEARPFVMEYRIVSRDGRIKWVWEKGHVIRGERGGEDLIEGFIQDSSDRRNAEQALRDANLELERRVRERTAQLENINQELEAFSYSVSHDLRTPLRGIDGFSRILLQSHADVLGEQGRHYLERVRAGTQRMGALIDDLLTLSRVSRRELMPERVDLSVIAKELIRELQQTEPDREVTISIQPDVIVSGDASLLRILLQNLLGNAWKFTSTTTHPRIEFGQTRGNAAEFYVRDNGAGFDAAYAEKLFVAFQRLHSADEFEGTGIGLATAHRVVRKHGGTLRGEGRVGAGATFYFTLNGINGEGASV
jgi:PAS domain S-box-containing protein